MNFTPTSKLVSVNVGGNLHDVARYVRECGFSDFFVQADHVGGAGSVVLLRLPADWPMDGYDPVSASAAEKKHKLNFSAMTHLRRNDKNLDATARQFLKDQKQ